MLSTKWLRAAQRDLFGSSSGRRRAADATRIPCRPQVERLEDRNLLACMSSDPFICTPLPQEGEAVHIHPKLSIFINDQQQVIPANLGIQLNQQGNPTAFFPLHTHDTSGTIHVESPIVRDFHLRDFFDTWEQTFTAQEILGRQVDPTRPIQMTVNGQPSNALGDLLLHDGDDIVIRAQEATPDQTANQMFVAATYQDLLGRPAESAGMAFWVGRLQQGTSRRDVVLEIQRSEECRTVTVQGICQSLLHRPADAQQLSSFVPILGVGGTVEQVRAAIAGSAEYLQNRGEGTTDGFLDALYQDALGRAIDPGAREFFSQALASGASHRQLAEAVFTSDEYREKLVESLYQQYHQRGTDPSGHDYFTGALRQGATDQQVITGILESAEYFQNSSRRNQQGPS